MQEEEVEDVFLNIPSAKTANLISYVTYATYVLDNLEAIFSFNCSETGEGRFHCYQGVQRAREEMVNILLKMIQTGTQNFYVITLYNIVDMDVISI